MAKMQLNFPPPPEYVQPPPESVILELTPTEAGALLGVLGRAIYAQGTMDLYCELSELKNHENTREQANATYETARFSNEPGITPAWLAPGEERKRPGR